MYDAVTCENLRMQDYISAKHARCIADKDSHVSPLARRPALHLDASYPPVTGLHERIASVLPTCIAACLLPRVAPGDVPRRRTTTHWPPTDPWVIGTAAVYRMRVRSRPGISTVTSVCGAIAPQGYMQVNMIYVHPQQNSDLLCSPRTRLVFRDPSPNKRQVSRNGHRLSPPTRQPTTCPRRSMTYTPCWALENLSITFCSPQR